MVDETLDVNEPVTGHDKGRRSLVLPKPVHHEPGLPDPHGEPGEVAVARYQTEAVKLVSIQQVHGVDNHGGVGRVLAVSIGKLLDRLDGLLEELILPPTQRSAGPVTVGALYAHNPISSDFREQRTDPGMLCVVRINEDRQLERRG